MTLKPHHAQNSNSANVGPTDLPWFELFCIENGLTEKPLMVRDLRDIATRINHPNHCRKLFDFIASMLHQIPDAALALTSLDRLLVIQPASTNVIVQWLGDQKKLERLLKLLGTSPFLSQIVLSQFFEVESLLAFDCISREAIVAEAIGLTADCDSEKHVAEVLRRFRLKWTLKIAASELYDENTVKATTGAVSDLADACLDAALSWSLTRNAIKTGLPRKSSGETCQIVALALGKLGGHELNYSSDVDLIFLYDEDGSTPSARPHSASAFYAKVIADFLRIMSGAGTSSFILRVDLRLRPEGAQGPILMNLEQTLNYYDSIGRTWERQALIKVRPCAGQLQLGHQFQAMIEPFVYRRYLTSHEIAEIRAIKRRIEHRTTSSGTAEWDVKTGFGGIRDIEFVVQFLQLLNGCTLPELRLNQTLETLEKLKSTGCLTTDEFEILRDNYIFLRRVEHRLQLFDDRQTHRIPEQHQTRQILARLMNYRPLNAWESPAGPFERFMRDYRNKTAQNHNILNRLLHDTFQNEIEEGTDLLTDLVLDPEMPEELKNQAMEQLGFQHRAVALTHIQSLAREEKPFFSTPRCRHFFSALAPKLLKAVASTANPDHTLSQLEAVTHQIPGKVAVWEFLNQNPHALQSFVNIAGYQKLTTELMISRPNSWENWSHCFKSRTIVTSKILESEFQKQLKSTENAQEALRNIHDQTWLEIAARLKIPISPENAIQASFELATLAKTIVSIAANRIWSEGLIRWRQTTSAQTWPGNWGIVALGKLGGDDLLFHSDIDLMFLHEVNAKLPTNRLKQAAESFFQDLASRLVRCLSEGGKNFLYRVDTRLRPFGSSGPLSVSSDALQLYYAGSDARIWERLALLRARPVYAQGFEEQQLKSMLHRLSYSMEFSRSQTIHEIKELRTRTLASCHSARIDIKRAEGGLHEAELLVQLMQWTGFQLMIEPPLTNFWQAVRQLERMNLIRPRIKQKLKKAYSLFRQIEMALRLVRNRPTNTIEIQPEEIPFLERMIELPAEHNGTDLNSLILSQMAVVHGIFQDWLDADDSSTSSATV